MCLTIYASQCAFGYLLRTLEQSSTMSVEQTWYEVRYFPKFSHKIEEFRDMIGSDELVG